VLLTSKLIDRHLSGLRRVIPAGNDKELIVDKKEFEQAVTGWSDRFERARPRVKLSLTSAG